MATFPPIYVINLKRTPERRIHIQKQLDALSLEYELVDAIDKYELKSKADRIKIARLLGIEKSIIENKYAAIVEHAKIKQDKNWKNAGTGHLAIILSHIKIYDLMVKNDIDMACILEDDANPLPTFPEVLKIAPKLEWDILLLANNSVGLSSKILKNPIKRLRIFGKDLVFLSHQLKKTPITQNKKDYRIKRLLEEYGFNSHIYSKQSESLIDIIKEYDSKYAEISKTIMPANRRLSLIKPERYINYRTLRRYLKAYIFMQFGALPQKNSLDLITKYHCMAEPKHLTFSATAYLVRQPAAMKWKHQALANNPLVVDYVPWELYKNKQVKLRIITPPCAIPTQSSFKYSARLR